ncbi:uncharacterized protein [Panulirus ornatus]|uniref:uncharacterized protein isoform X2 n=1 Tax=Panulirus ornatus TaxID=150431 RepID=UPI003A87C1FF
MSITPLATCMEEADLHFLRYFLAFKVGKTVMKWVFEWGYQGGHPIRNYLLSQPGYSRRKFKNDFNQDQRRKLTSSTPDDVGNYDISLLYTLLQLTCGLADSTDPVWKAFGPSLENLLFRLKQLHDNIVLEEQHLTQRSLDTKLFELQELLENIYQSAAVRFGKSSQTVSQLCTELSQQFTDINAKIRETLQPADLLGLKQLQQEIQDYGEHIIQKIKKLGFKELAEQYQVICKIDPAPWLRRNVQFKPSLTFIDLQIEEDEVVCGRPSQTEKTLGVKCEEILRVTRKDGSKPDVIIMTGEGGMGKTTLLKYLIEKWVSDQRSVNDLDQVDIMLYIQCRESGIRSFDQLLKQLLQKTLQRSCGDLDFFRDIILRLKTIILIDGYDEANEDSKILMKDILQVAGKVRVIVTTRPGCGDHLVPLIPSGKRCLDLLVKGIAPKLRSQYVSNTVDILVDDGDQRANVKEAVSAKLEDIKETTEQHLNNPLTLTLVTLLWVECPEKFNAFTTVTELYDELRDLLTGKLIERLTGKVGNPEEKCKQFLTLYDDLALQSIKKTEFDLSKDTLRTLTEKCKSLGLPRVDVLSSYLTRKRSRQGLKLIWIWSYLHRGFQEHAASRSILKTLLDSDEEQSRSSHQSTAPYNKSNVIKHMFTDVLDLMLISSENVLFLLTGALASLSEKHLLRYFPDLLQVLPIVIHYDGSAHIDAQLSFALESKNHPMVIQEVARMFSENRKWSSGGHHWKALPPILSLANPDEMKIEILRDPEMYPDLQQGLEALAKTTVNVQLHLTKHYSKSKGVSDAFIKAVNSSSCTLTEFSGRVTSPSLLPDTLEWLWLRCTKEDLQMLASRLPTLLNLKHLNIIVEVIGKPKAETFPVLPFTGLRLLVTLEADVTDNQEDVDWCCDVMRQMCHRDRKQGYESIGFYQTKFTGPWMERLIRGLYEQGLVNEASLDMRSYSQITKEEENKLAILYKELGGSYMSLSSDDF